MVKKKIHFSSSLAYYKIGDYLKNYINNDTIIICIGTDKCIGDCLGPLVGSILKDKFFPLPVYGTINSPIHALNIKDSLMEINKRHPNAKAIGIDACLGDDSSIGEIHIRDYPIHPGKGVGKSLPDVGVCSIIGIVDSCNSTELFTNRNIRLDLIVKMAKIISLGILEAYSLNNYN